MLALRGSNGVGKGALKCLPRPSRCRAAYFLVSLPSKTHSKIDKLKELLHLAREVFNILGSRLALTLLEQPGAARSSQEEPGGARRSQEQPGGAWSSQEKAGATRRSQEQPV